MGSNAKKSANTLQSRTNQRGGTLWQVVDDTDKGGFAQLGKRGRTAYADAAKKPVFGYDELIQSSGESGRVRGNADKQPRSVRFI